MKVSIVQGGGFVPVVTTTVADADALTPTDADALATKVHASGLLELARAGTAGGTAPGAAAPHPDEPSYRITVEQDGRQHQVVLPDGALPDPVRDLIAWVGQVPGHEESVGGL